MCVRITISDQTPKLAEIPASIENRDYWIDLIATFVLSFEEVTQVEVSITKSEAHHYVRIKGDDKLIEHYKSPLVKQPKGLKGRISGYGHFTNQILVRLD